MREYLLLATTGDLEEDIRRLAIRMVLAAAVSLVVLVGIAALTKNKYDHLRTPLFLLIAFVVLSTTITMFASTIYLNVKSDSKGPVHWHADIEFWACGSQLELRNPSGFLSNKIGTPTLHEHDDQRIHLEGVVVKKEIDASLGKFMAVVGGSISNDAMIVPIADSIVEDDVDGDSVDPRGSATVQSFVETDSLGKHRFAASNGDFCDDQPAKPQVFVYRYNEDDKSYSQSKLEDPSAYVMRDESIVPPGDCLIVEFAPEKDRTDKLCRQYGVRDRDRCVEFGVKEFTEKLCNIREVPVTGGGNN